MKLKNLLILGAMLIAGSQVALADGERQEPNLLDFLVETIEIDGESEYYMYNEDAGKFWVGANAWGTQASVGPTGWKVRFKQHVTGASWDGKTVLMEDDVNGKWLKAWFVGDFPIMYTDYNNQTDYIWCIQKVGDAYRLSPSASNPTAFVKNLADKFVGINTSKKDSILYCDLTESDTTWIDWKFASVSAYQEGLKIFETAQSLLGFIEQAEAKGFDATAQRAVYADKNATLEQVNEAVAIVVEFLNTKASPEEPLDKTLYIVNPHYSDGKTDWTDDNDGQWAVSWGVSEHYDDLFNHYQDVTKQPKGVYMLTLRGYVRPYSAASAFERFNKGEETTAFLYASVEGDTVVTALPNIWVGASETALSVGTNSKETDANGKDWYVANNMEGAAAYFDDPVLGPKYDASLLFGIDDDSVRIGLRMDSKAAADWVLWDNWRLTYFGSSEDAYKYWAQKLVEGAPVFPADAVVTKGTLETYAQIIGGLTASDMVGAKAVRNTIAEASAAVQSNIDAWAKYQELIVLATSYTSDNSLGESDIKMEMAMYLMLEAPMHVQSLTLATEELMVEIEKLQTYIDRTLRESLKVGSNVTEKFLVNPKFEESEGKSDGRGWEGDWTDINGPKENRVMELYGGWDAGAHHPDFDVHQVVKEAPVGLYEISLNGFYRKGDNADAYKEYEEATAAGQTITSHVSIYVNNNYSPFKNIYSEPVQCPELYSATAVYGPTPYLPGDSTGYWYPNGMYDAGVAFMQGMYPASAHGLVFEQGDELRIGVKATGMIQREWAIFDNFNMVYWGKQIDKVKPHLAEAIKVADDNLKKALDIDTYELLVAAKEKAVVAQNSTDENEVFDALADLFATNDSVIAATLLFDELKTAAIELETTLANYEDAPQSVINEAFDLSSKLMGALEGDLITKAEARNLIDMVPPMIVKLKIPNNNHSDDTPTDLTHLLKTPNFDDNGANSTAGWTGASGSYGNDDTQKGALAYEFYQKTFDLYQELNYLPNGTYRIEVSAFNRHGNSLQDYDSYQLNPDSSSAYIYGMDCAKDTLVYKQSLTRLAKYADMAYLSWGLDSTDFVAVDTLKNVELGADSIMWVPNKIVGAVNLFEIDYFKNTVYAEVTDGTLRIGMKKDVQVSNDWVILDTWKLFYHGTASQFKPTSVGEVLVAAPGAPVKVEVYNLNGVRLNKLQKGVNIIRTIHADGQVTVKKRLVK